MAMDDQKDGSDLDVTAVPGEASGVGDASSHEASARESSVRDTSPPSMARLTISLPRSLYRDIRLHALDLDTTLSALLVRLIREELKVSSPE